MLRDATLVALSFALGMAFVKNVAPYTGKAEVREEVIAPVAPAPSSETKPYNNGQPEDRYFSPDPHWKVERELWEMRGRPYERPIAPAQRIKIPCWEYGDECGIPGGACGKIRKLAERDLYKEECDALRPRRRPASYSRSAPRCPRGGCPVDEQEQ